MSAPIAHVLAAAVALSTISVAALAGAEPPGATLPAGDADAPAAKPSPELGAVRWGRDFDAALSRSKSTGKPVLILFDEVPGCHTCISYGQTVLTHPLIVEAIEDLFVPVAVFNNVGGADRAVLKSFGEAEWNNPVVRIVNAERKELAAKVDGDYTSRGILVAMVKALRGAERPVPKYLELLEQETAPSEKAVFSMTCFWSGEVRLGALDGVLATRPGYTFSWGESIEVTFDPARITRAALAKKAEEAACTVRSPRDAVTTSAKDDKYQLRGTALESIPMSPIQATRVNAAVGSLGDMFAFLSPRQMALLRRIAPLDPDKRLCLLGRTDLAAAWAEADGVAP